MLYKYKVLKKLELMVGKQASYRQIIKATSIFGGVQIFNIIIAIFRSKCIAVLLGPTGIGINGLLISTTGIIASITNFGLGTSAVRNVSIAAASEDHAKISATITIIRRLVWVTGVLGTLITLFLSSYLSELTFGNESYTIAFRCISITLLLSQLSAGQFVILQGLRELKYLAKADVVGMLAGLLITIPIYYKYGIKGVVPALVASAAISLAVSWYFASKIKLIKTLVNRSTFISESFSMLKMGFLLSFSGLISVAASYILKVYIGRFGGVEQVGLYNAGFAIINTYVGMIFTAMTTDYYPRLAAVAADPIKICSTINDQAVIAMLLIAPILVAFITFIDWAVILLYSSDFIAINNMLQWTALGMFFKTVSWAIGFILLAKGASRMFFWNELIANIYLLLLNLVGYKYWGLSGLGLSFLIGYIVFFLQVFYVVTKNYKFKFDNAFYKIFIVQFTLALFSFLSITNTSAPFSYLLCLMFIILSIFYSLYELNKRMALIQMANGLKYKIRNRYNLAKR